MGRMHRIGIERVLAVELAVEHHVAGIGDAAGVDADLDVQQAWDLAPQTLEGLAETGNVGGAFGSRGAEHVPHHDVLDHADSGAGDVEMPASAPLLHFLKTAKKLGIWKSLFHFEE